MQYSSVKCAAFEYISVIKLPFYLFTPPFHSTYLYFPPNRPQYKIPVKFPKESHAITHLYSTTHIHPFFKTCTSFSIHLQLLIQRKILSQNISFLMIISPETSYILYKTLQKTALNRPALLDYYYFPPLTLSYQQQQQTFAHSSILFANQLSSCSSLLSPFTKTLILSPPNFLLLFLVLQPH